MPNMRIQALNYRVLRELDWRPEGVCLLAGANGAGKTTALSAFEFLRVLFQSGHEAAFVGLGGVNFVRRAAPTHELVEFTLSVDELRWKLRFPMTARGLRGHYAEELYRGDQVILRASMVEERWFLGTEPQPLDETRSCARVLWDRGDSPWMKPLVDTLSGVRVHPTFSVEAVKRIDAVQANVSSLNASGDNLWSVLATWQASSIRFPGQFDWVMAQARAAFPDHMNTVQFDRGLPIIFERGETDPSGGLLPNRAADGLLAGLLLLTAVAGAREGAVVCIDEVETHLHPHAIRSIVHAIRARADDLGFTVLLTTHSPVVMNTFRYEPEQLFVLRRGEEAQPKALTELRDAPSLIQTELGELFDRLDFGAPDLHAASPKG